MKINPGGEVLGVPLSKSSVESVDIQDYADRLIPEDEAKFLQDCFTEANKGEPEMSEEEIDAVVYEARIPLEEMPDEVKEMVEKALSQGGVLSSAEMNREDAMKMAKALGMPEDVMKEIFKMDEDEVDELEMEKAGDWWDEDFQ